MRTLPLSDIIGLAVFMLLLAACRTPVKSGGDGRSGTFKRKTAVKFNGLSRTYRLHLPSTEAPSAGWPLLVMLHGAFNTAAKTEQETGFSEVADERGFLVAYANGIGVFGLLQHWNAGHCCGKAVRDGVDDVAYIDAVIHDAVETCPVDSSRIYMVGHSKGGMMAYRYTMERAGKIAAAAVFAGALDSK
ncbi:MAG: hypothetical protein K9M45_07545, partial [Kiritimatiellales bacterium]|nr:hypothetical protein [Kiritimatiellales bacterium]